MKKYKITSALIALAVLVAAAFLITAIPPATSETVPQLEADTVTEAPLVRLSQRKRQIAGIRTLRVTRQTVRSTRILPGRFAYDDTRHVAVRAAADGVLESVLVKTGDRVKVGQTLAIIRSPAVGAARSKILSCQARWVLAVKEHAWDKEICASVEQLASLIRQGESLAAIEERFQDAKLGSYRAQLLTKYSKSRLATKLTSSVRNIGQSGAVSGRVVQQRESDQEQSKAELEANVEQALFETNQTCQRSAAAEAAAKRELLVARQTLGTLIGTTAKTTERLDVSPNDTNLSRLTIVSPLTGTVEQKRFSATERVTAEAELFVVADTSHLWVEADVRERDWSSINVKEGDVVHVTTPAIDELQFEAHVYFVGREFDPKSGAIPLVAKINNLSKGFRPGLFARVEVPTTELVDVIAVPKAAVVDLDGQSNVFVAQHDAFLPTTVQLGVESGDFVVVRSGLNEGQTIVANGAFVLKSELLLEGEE